MPFPLRKVSLVILLMGLLCQSHGVKAQSNSYYAKGDSLVLTDKVFSSSLESNCRKIKVRTIDKQIKEFKPFEIDEYRTRSGDTFYSRRIEYKGQLNEVFLLKNNENIPLYTFSPKRGEKIYFLEINGDLVELVEEDEMYKIQLNEAAQCQDNYNFSANTRYNQFSLEQTLIRLLDCSKQILPHNRYGVGLTLLSNKVDYNYNANIQDRFSAPSIMPYAWFETPIRSSSFSVRASFGYRYINIKSTTFGTNENSDFFFEASMVSIPVVLKKTWWNNKGGFSIESGVLGSYSIQTKETILLTQEQENNEVLVNEISTKKGKPSSYGITGGIGYTFYYNQQKSIGFRINYMFTEGNSSVLSRESGLLFSISLGL